MEVLNGYNVPVTKAGQFRVAWGDWEPGQIYLDVIIIHWPDGMVRVIARGAGGEEAWCEREPCDGDNVLDYVRVAHDMEQFAHGNNGYYVEYSSDPDGERGTHRVNQDDDPLSPVSKATMVIWRNHEW